MKHLLCTIIFLLLVSCGSGGSSGGSSQVLSENPEPPSVTGDLNVTLNNTVILQGGPAYTDADFAGQFIEISITNHSFDQSISYRIIISDNGFDRAINTGTLDPEQTKTYDQSVSEWLGGKTGSHNLKIDVDTNVIETETEDNYIEQSIYIVGEGSA